MEEGKAERPLGIAILAVLDIIGGILGLFGGISMAALSTIIAEMMEEMGGLPGFEGLFGAAIEVMFLVLGITAIIMGIVAVAVGWGFWKGTEWAWILGIALYAIGIILGVVSLAGGNVFSVISIIIGALIVYYLFRPNVKAWFGKA